MTDSKIILEKSGAVTFSGPDATNLFRLMTIRQGIAMHKDFGMIPTRGWTITRMLDAVTAMTGKPYKGAAKHDKALADLTTQIDALKADVPVVEAA